ncbi:MAG: L-seryl-tRNA(Sec) selenium transferase [Thermoanaerobaculia bacterium]|nr:L-seryl-tRNA(Sec) selenium transferase [Thermoanaerobaculia bacterium]
MKQVDRALLRQLPAVDRIMQWSGVQQLITLYGRDVVRVQVRNGLEELREQIGSGSLTEVPTEEEMARGFARAVEGALGGRLRRVINATGIFLHTNLGRAPLPPEVLARLALDAEAACSLEFDLVTGTRGDRNQRVDRLLAALTGCEAAVAVNNNAAALVLVLSTLASGREVILSRGEMVEIGGSFRIPDILRSSGARLVEVGTTNRTRLADYRSALSKSTGLLLKVHPSNYRVRGFTSSTSTADLVALGLEHGVPVVVDEGSGLLKPRSEAPFVDHESVSELIAAGASLVCSSGDKVLGGPQAGLLMGQRAWVDRCRQHPLYRAFRPGRLTYSGLEETLRRLLGGEASLLDRLWPDTGQHQRRLDRFISRLAEATSVPVEGYVGGGAAPDAAVVGVGVSLPTWKGQLEALRLGEPAVVAYVRQDRLIVDLRTVESDDDEALIGALLAAEAGSHGVRQG